MSRNEAAERLMGLAVYVEKYDLDMMPVYEGGVNLLQEALATERRLTVERVRKAAHLDDSGDPNKHEPKLCHAAFQAALAKALLDDLAIADVDEEEGNG